MDDDDDDGVDRMGGVDEESSFEKEERGIRTRFGERAEAGIGAERKKE